MHPFRVLLSVIVLLLPALLTARESAPLMKSIREFNVLPQNSAAENRDRLQEAIDWATERGAALWVEPSDEPYPMAGGLLLRMNVSLVGAHGPVGRGTKHPSKPQPVGSVFAIEDEEQVFLTVEGATRVEGIQFWYPRQTLHDPEAIIEYPPTIQVSQERNVFSVTLSRLSFYGEYMAIDFNSPARAAHEQVLVEHCYGYPLSGEFIRINHCYDIPRILNCHVNPATMRNFAGDFGKAVIDAVIARKSFAYSIDHTDNAQLIDVFTFGTYGGIRLGPAAYGQMTNFNFDCVTVGIHKLGDNTFNRNWQIAQGSIIANVGASVEEIHPVIVEGQGHTSLVNVEAFSGGNPALTVLGQSQDFLLVRGDQKLTVSLFGCRMRNYAADHPVTVENPLAVVQAVACVDKNEEPFATLLPPSGREKEEE